MEPHVCNTMEMVKGPQSSLQDRWTVNKGRLGLYEEGPCNSEATVFSNNTPDLSQSCLWSFT